MPPNTLSAVAQIAGAAARVGLVPKAVALVDWAAGCELEALAGVCAVGVRPSVVERRIARRLTVEATASPPMKISLQRATMLAADLIVMIGAGLAGTVNPSLPTTYWANAVLLMRPEPLLGLLQGEAVAQVVVDP